MTDAYRIVVWGPGNLGKIAIREILRSDRFEVVGARAFSERNDGVDLGSLAGVDPCGVTATTDVAAALAVDCDCVLHLERDFGRYGAVDELEAILLAGRDVVTVHPFQHLDNAGRTGVTVEIADRLRAAAETGGATFHATGIHPGFVVDRLATTLTGVCTDIESVAVHENWDHAHFDHATLSILGFGSDPAELSARPAVTRMVDNYVLENLYGLAARLGVHLVRAESAYEFAPAPVDLSFETIDVPEGSVGRITRTWRGYREGDRSPFVVMGVNWLLGRAEMVPEGFDPGDYYVVRIEGTPSVEMALRFKGSLARDEYLVRSGDRGSDPGYYGVIGVLLNAVPRVVAAEPGVLGLVPVEGHWVHLSAPAPAR